MDEDGASGFTSIAEAATASWFAHRASTPSLKQSPSISRGGSENMSQTQAQRQTQIPAPFSIGMSSTEPLATPAPAPGLRSESESSSTPTSTRSRAESGTLAERNGDGGVRSDITAWQGALLCLPPALSKADLPAHPLARALCNQPTLRPVEWNQHRQQGGFVPRTAHDYSSLMIYLCGQVNPNPCRNCRLRNGPYARCVVSPPSVLAISTLRHACANCTYQNQYKKCSNAPISEEEMIRVGIQRGHRPIVPRQSIINSRTKTKKRLESIQQSQQQAQTQAQTQPVRLPLQDVPSPSADNGTPSGLPSFEDKLRHIRAWSPRSRRRMIAEALQWQSAIATVEAEEVTRATNHPNSEARRPEFSLYPPSAPAPAPAPASVPARALAPPPLYNGVPVPEPPHRPPKARPMPTVSATFIAPSPAGERQQGSQTPHHGIGYAHDPMDEDESESDSDSDSDSESERGGEQEAAM
ncbi:hypothetical protein GGS20DRAFT_589307 [Poronia punctata]|nr:hypothetical protein GGS20DRAFT_589307 [Poronia punctata]